MLHRCVHANFLKKHRKIREHEWKILTNYPSNMQNFPKHQRFLEKQLRILQNFKNIPKFSQNFATILQRNSKFVMFPPVRRNELALSLCELVNNLCNQGKLSINIFGQWDFPGCSLFTGQKIFGISFSRTIDFIFFVNISWKS